MQNNIENMNKELECRLDELIAELFPAAFFDKSAKGYRCGSIHGEPGKSMIIWASGRKLGNWCDFASSDGGDLFSLVFKALNLTSYKDCFKWINDFCGTGTIDCEQKEKRYKEIEIKKKELASKEEAKAKQLKEKAIRLFMEASPLPNSPVEKYLYCRGIDLRKRGVAPSALRYHPKIFSQETGKHHPCMLARVENMNEKIVTIHRTFLKIWDDGRVTKNDIKSGGNMEDAKKIYSSYFGGWVPISNGISKEPMQNLPKWEEILVAEGIETALTLALAMPEKRVISALSLSNIGALTLPENAGVLCLCADNDVKIKAKEAFERQKSNLMGRGFLVEVFRPPAQFNDFNDWGNFILSLKKEA